MNMLRQKCVVLLFALVFPTGVVAGITETGLNDEVLALTLYNGDLIAGGKFTMAGDIPVNCIARWDGSSWHPLGEGITGVQMFWNSIGDTLYLDPQVNAFVEYRGDLIVGGMFSHAGGLEFVSIARWDGANWTPLGGGIADYYVDYHVGIFSYFPPQIHTLAVHEDSLHVGGLFDQAGGTDANFMAAWDGIAWHSLGEGVGDGRPPRILTSIVYEDELTLGGNFSSAGDMAIPYITGWDNTKWIDLGFGLGPIAADTEARCLLTYNGDLIVGGQFSTAGGAPANNIAAWNNVSWSPLGNGLNNTVHALAVYQNELYAGAFRWENDTWVNALQTDGPVKAMVVYGDSLVVGGDFNLIDGTPCQNIATWYKTMTPVYLISFTAVRQGDRALVRWETAFERGEAEFSVWRQSPGQEKVPVNGRVNDPADLQFSFTDPHAPTSEVDYWLQETTSSGQVSWYGPAHLEPAIPVRFHLAQNSPNPFNPHTTFFFTLPQAEPIRLTVYDVQGRIVATLADEVREAGEHRVSWDGRDRQGSAVASGVYVVRLHSPHGSHARKITLAR
jgi:hypothetical protein